MYKTKSELFREKKNKPKNKKKKNKTKWLSHTVFRVCVSVWFPASDCDISKSLQQWADWCYFEAALLKNGYKFSLNYSLRHLVFDACCDGSGHPQAACRPSILHEIWLRHQVASFDSQNWPRFMIIYRHLTKRIPSSYTIVIEICLQFFAFLDEHWTKRNYLNFF